MRWTVHRAAIEWGVDHKSLAKWLSMQGHELKKGKTYHTREISRAVMGDLDFERTRLTRAEADLREMEKAERAKTLVSMDDVAALVNPILLAVRQRFNALPSEAGSKCNPTDPQLAEQQLSSWVERTLPLIREQLPKAGAPQ